MSRVPSRTCRASTDPRRRRGFTLIELMVAIAVASLLAATALVTMWGAQETASEARTQAQVAKINDLIITQWESYPTRKLTIDYSMGFSPTPRDKLQARLVLLRDTMRMEMPDRITDLSNPRVTLTFRDNNGNFRGAAQLHVEPRVWRAYQRKCLRILGQDPSKPLGTPNWSNWTPQFQGAECLYLILSELRDGDASVLSYFRDTEMTDVDNDGMLEISDGWGNPIIFLRWAPGFASDIQYLSRDRQPDHLDPLHTDPRWDPNWVHVNPALRAPYTLFPLIYSAGPDRSYAMKTDTNAGPPLHNYRTTSPIPMDPYAPTSDGGYIGDLDTSDPGSRDDNITNHFIEVR